jgi:predicted nucleic acid-binding protein
MQRLPGTRIYVDANVFILFAENAAGYGEVLRELFRGIDGGAWELVTSELTFAEILVRPLQSQNAILIAAYETILTGRPGFTRLPVDLATLRMSAQLRAEHGHRLADAIHFASALLTGCSFLITEDKRMRSFGQLAVLRLSDLVMAPAPPSATP